jgi:fluoride ion exporter CrcB/FEX
MISLALGVGGGTFDDRWVGIVVVGIMGGFSTGPTFRFDRSCVARPLKRTPLFPEKISCLVLIMGGSG